VTEQARRISTCRLTFFTERGGGELRQTGAFVRDANTLSDLYMAILFPAAIGQPQSFVLFACRLTDLRHLRCAEAG
jgi:hypothetical protein